MSRVSCSMLAEFKLKYIYLALCFIATCVFADFQIIMYYPWGAQGDCRLNIADTDHDGFYELIFLLNLDITTGEIRFMEQSTNPFYFHNDGAITFSYDTLCLSPWAVCDADNDSLPDIICDYAISYYQYGMAVYESPDMFSHPTKLVWRDTVSYGALFPKSAYDIDQDGYVEFINNHSQAPNYTWIYEATGNNMYDTVVTLPFDTIYYDNPISLYAFGDFDQDSRNEFVGSGSTSGYWVYECQGNNQYVQTFRYFSFLYNATDCFTVPDADGDSRMEFVVNANPPRSRNAYDALIVEATGDNTYATTATIHFSNVGEPGLYYSDAGNVDLDESPEIVITTGNKAYLIDAFGNDSFYVADSIDIYNGIQNVRIFDLDRDGISEIILSTLDNTGIFRITPTAANETGSNDLQPPFVVTPSHFSHYLMIHVTDSYKNTVVRIFDIAGKEVFAREIQDKCSSTKINTEILPTGIYFIQLQAPDRTITRKAVKIQ